jgi:hypothetical protein
MYQDPFNSDTESEISDTDSVDPYTFERIMFYELCKGPSTEKIQINRQKDRVAIPLKRRIKPIKKRSENIKKQKMSSSDFRFKETTIRITSLKNTCNHSIQLSQPNIKLIEYSEKNPLISYVQNSVSYMRYINYSSMKKPLLLFPENSNQWIYENELSKSVAFEHLLDPSYSYFLLDSQEKNANRYRLIDVDNKIMLIGQQEPSIEIPYPYSYELKKIELGIVEFFLKYKFPNEIVLTVEFIHYRLCEEIPWSRKIIDIEKLENLLQSLGFQRINEFSQKYKINMNQRTLDGNISSQDLSCYWHYCKEVNNLLNEGIDISLLLKKGKLSWNTMMHSLYKLLCTLANSSLQSLLETTRWIYKRLTRSIWHKTNSFWSAINGESTMKIDGIGDETEIGASIDYSKSFDSKDDNDFDVDIKNKISKIAFKQQEYLSCKEDNDDDDDDDDDDKLLLEFESLFQNPLNESKKQKILKRTYFKNGKAHRIVYFRLDLNDEYTRSTSTNINNINFISTIPVPNPLNQIEKNKNNDNTIFQNKLMFLSKRYQTEKFKKTNHRKITPMIRLNLMCKEILENTVGLDFNKVLSDMIDSNIFTSMQHFMCIFQNTLGEEITNQYNQQIKTTMNFLVMKGLAKVERDVNVTLNKKIKSKKR